MDGPVLNKGLESLFNRLLVKHTAAREPFLLVFDDGVYQHVLEAHKFVCNSGALERNHEPSRRGIIGFHREEGEQHTEIHEGRIPVRIGQRGDELRALCRRPDVDFGYFHCLQRNRPLHTVLYCATP